jgi:hypothetical protein
MKKINKILSIILAVLSTACFAVGCTDGEDVAPVQANVYNGTHILTAKATDKDLVKNGQCDYVLVTPKEDSKLLRDAKNEFLYFFEMATGITLKTTTDEGLTHNPNNKYISLGETTLLQSANVKWDKKQLGTDGVRIVTKDNTIFLVGGSDYGTVNSVYTFMEITFDLEVYYYDCIEIQKNVANKKLAAYDVTDIPDIKLRQTTYEIIRKPFSSDYDVMQFGARLRYTRTFYDTCYAPYNSYNDAERATSPSHNTNTYVLPESEFKSLHPKWYSDNGAQWCYTAHGDAAEYEAMQEEVLNKIAYTIKRQYSSTNIKQYVNLFMEDNYEICTCKSCTDVFNKYEVHTAAVILFMNDLGERFEAWAKQPENLQYEAQDVIINMIAYQDFVEPPVKYDQKKGEYVPIDSAVKLRKNVGVRIADIYADYQQALNTEHHERTKQIVQGWGSLTKNIHFWTYPNNFKFTLYMYDTYSFFTGDTLAFYANNGQGMYMETCSQTSVLTTWKSLQFWLYSKLQWDTSLDEQTLIDDWFRAVFKDAAPIMQSYFMDMRTHAATAYAAEGGMYDKMTCYNKVEKKSLWPINTLRAWIKKCDEALAAVEKYKYIDEDLYTATTNHIHVETISPLYILLNLYLKDLSKQEKTDLVNRVYLMQETLPMDKLELRQKSTGAAFMDFINSIA